jgi:Domain of unknown function (DUF4037)
MTGEGAPPLKDVQTPNLWSVVRPLLITHLETFKRYPEIEGLVVLGGASSRSGHRGIDEYSDLDASIFISLPEAKEWVGRPNSVRAFLDESQHLLPDWLPPFESRVRCESVPAGEIGLDVHQLIVELEEDDTRSWDEPRRQAYSDTAEIIFDRSGRVSRIIERKTQWSDDEVWRTLARVIAQLSWSGRVNPSRQLARGFPDHAHDLLTEAIDGLVHVVYIANRRYRPHRKWRLRECFSLPFLPPEFEQRVLAALLVPDLEASHVEARIQLVSGLIADVTELASRHWELPADCYRSACQLSYEDRQLRIEAGLPGAFLPATFGRLQE